MTINSYHDIPESAQHRCNEASRDSEGGYRRRDLFSNRRQSGRRAGGMRVRVKTLNIVVGSSGQCSRGGGSAVEMNMEGGEDGGREEGRVCNRTSNG